MNIEDRLRLRIAELEAELEVARGLDRSRTVEAQTIGSEFVRLQAARIAELEADTATRIADAATQIKRIAELEAALADKQRHYDAYVGGAVEGANARVKASVLAERRACLDLCKPWRDLNEIIDAIRARPAP